MLKQRHISQSIFLLATMLLLGACGTRRSGQNPPAFPFEQTNQHVITTPVLPEPTVSPTPSTVVCKMDAGVEPAESGTWRGNMQMALSALCQSETFQSSQMGIYVYDMTDGMPLYSLNSRQSMRPASCQKVVTSVSALHFLGAGHQFRTELRVTGNQRGNVLIGDVYVVGGMDPMLSSADVKTLAQTLLNQGIHSIVGNLYMDVSMKDDLPYGWGWCWDDDYGPLSALTVNGRDAFGSTWVQTLRQSGIRLRTSAVKSAVCPAQSRLLTTLSHSMEQVMGPLLKESDNIYAESMFYQLAATMTKKGAGRKHAVQRINELITALNLNPEDYRIADGSGLSLYNYVTPRLLVELLCYAYSQESIRTPLWNALPVAGVDGTLKNRMKNTPAYGNVHAKTGTVTGISSLSGYLTAANGHLLVFSIINQGVARTSIGRNFQDQICVTLCK